MLFMQAGKYIRYVSKKAAEINRTNFTYSHIFHRHSVFSVSSKLAYFRLYVNHYLWQKI